MIGRLTERAARRYPVNTGPTGNLSWPHSPRWRRLLNRWTGQPCPDCGVEPSARHRDGCLTGSWDGGTWA